MIILDRGRNKEIPKVMGCHLADLRIRYQHVEIKEDLFSTIGELTKGAFLNQLREDALLDQDELAMLVQMYLEHKCDMFKKLSGGVNERIYFLQMP